VALAAALPVLDDIDGIPGWVRPLLIVAVCALGIVSIVVAPALRYRVWRYAVRDNEIDLRHGWWAVTRTIVPMARVQHVETERSFVGELLGIATLSIHTAAGSVDVPGLLPETANVLRARIATHAHVPDDV
jgi:membrane protein YdbS with pleckstrin-like domain